MASTRTAPRSTTNTMNKPASSSFHAHHTNGSTSTYENNESTSSNTNPPSEFDSTSQRSALMKNVLQYEGIYRNPRFIHAVTVGLVGQQVVLHTTEHERFHGVLETISPNGDVLLSVAHRLDNNNNNDILNLSTTPQDLIDTIDTSTQTFELQKRLVLGPNIVEIVALDIDFSGQNKCLLDESSKVTTLEDERFNRMEHFYGSDEIDPGTLEDLDLGDDGKAGYDPEDMFHTNREKFQTTTDFDESKYTNVPIRSLSPSELAEIERKAAEIEKGARFEDVDEDDAGVKRPLEYNPTHHNDDGNSNPRNHPSSRSHPNDRRPEPRYDAEYNGSKRGAWRDSRPGGSGGNNRRGGMNNYPMNNSKQNQRAEGNQYVPSRPSDQSTNNRQQPYNNRSTRPARFNENRSPHEGRDSPSQAAADESTRGPRINSGSFSQGQNSGSTSPSTTVPARTSHPTGNRPPMGRNSPAPYTGSSSSRNNSTNTTSPTSTTYPTNATGPGNYSQQSNNKMTKKPSRNDQQYTNDETDASKPQRQQQQQQPPQQAPPHQQQQQQHQASSSSTNNPSNTVPLNRPSQLHTQQVKQQQQQSHQPPAPASNIPPPLTLPTQDDHPSSHEPITMNPPDSASHVANPPVFTPGTSHPTGLSTPSATKGASDLNPEADEFVPVFTRESNSRPESRGASTNTMPMSGFMPHPQAIHMFQQQPQQQVQQPQPQQQQPQQPVQQIPMMPPTHGQNTGTLYQQYYSPPFTNMPQFVNAAQQPMNVGMMGPPMITQSQMTNNAQNANNPGAGPMNTANGNAGPNYKANNNQPHSGETGNAGVNNIAPKKAVVSVRLDQGNASQQQQVVGGPPIMYPSQPVRYYSSDYMGPQGTPQTMQVPQIPFYCPINTPGIIQAAGVGPPQNIMVSSANSSGGPLASTPGSFYYPGVYADPRMYNVYQSGTSVNPGNVNSNWSMNRSPPQHQQQGQVNDQQRTYGGTGTGQNMVSQAPQPPTGAPNNAGMAGRSTSTSGPSGQTGAGGPPMTPQYSLNGTIPGTYAFGSANGWYPGAPPVLSPQTSVAPQINPYGMIFDPSQQQSMPQQATFIHPTSFDPTYYQQMQQQQQQQQAPPPQQGMDAVPPGSYNR